MNVKTTLELPAPLLHQVKAAALQYHTTMKAFFCDAVKEKLARTTQGNTLLRHQNIIPPPPNVPLKELKAIHKKMLADAAEIHPDDWK